MNCKGCKWLDETSNGGGYCAMVVRSKFFKTMPCTICDGRRAPRIRRPNDKCCELYCHGDFKKRYAKGCV